MNSTDPTYVPNPAEQFILNKIRQWPRLYANSHAVIADVLFNGVGTPKWTDDGLIICEDKAWDRENKTWVEYPYVIDEKLARSLFNNVFGKFPSSHDRSARSLINHIPLNADQSWLNEIALYLAGFRKYDDETIQIMAEARTFLYYGVRNNPQAREPETYISDFKAFLKKIPTWVARIAEVRYYQQHGHREVETFLGMDI